MSNESLVSAFADGEKTGWGNWYKGWENPVNETSAMKCLHFLRFLCAAYQEMLTNVNEQHEAGKENLRKQNKDNLDSFKNGQSTTVDELKKKCEQDIAELDNLKRLTYDQYDDDLASYLQQTKRTSKGAKRIMEKIVSGTASSQETVRRAAEQRMLAARDELLRSIENQKAQRRLLLEKQVYEAQVRGECGTSDESSRYNTALEKLQSDYKNSVSELKKRIQTALEIVMNDRAISGYTKTVYSSIKPYEGFTCSTTIPDIVYFGDVSLEIGKKTELLPEVSQFFSFEAKKVIDDHSPGVLKAKLPYCQTLDDGISLFLNYTSTERKLYQEHLKALLLRLFMAFPAGKLEATMIDPLELGGTFATFTKLGEEQARIIDTKIWSQEKDITEAINILRQKIETMTQSYGDDKVTRLKKEPVRVLAITDFPTGFSQNALRDLQAIVRKSASYGVCVFIWANTEEIAKLQASQQSIFNEIKQMLHVASVSGNELLLETSKFPDIKLNLDNSDMLSGNVSSVINTLAKGIHGSQKKIERFEDMFDGIEDPNNWFAENTATELSIPIGIKGANTVVKMIVGKNDGSTAHHALIAGQTGAGKSTLLHTIIMSTLLNYSPDEAQMYLVDFKEGVEFKTYSKLNLPSIKVVAIDCEREFGLNILKELQKEMKRRFDLFKREADREEISDYRKVTGKKIPKLLAIFDEVQELFRSGNDDGISKECETILGELLTLGRAAGIHIVLASQNFNLISSIKPILFAHAAIRIAIKGSEDSANSVLGDGNPGAKQLQDGATGAAVYNDASGRESANVIFQVGYLDKEKRAEYLAQLNALQNGEAFRRKYKTQTRVLLTNAEDDIFNVFNQLILNKKVSTLDEDDTKYCLTIGDGFELNRKFKIGIAPKSRQNLLVIGKDEKRAASMFYFSILSLLYGELGNDEMKKDNQLVHLIDLSVEDEYSEPDTTNFRHIQGLFPKQVKRVRINEMEDLISSTYDTMIRRMDGEEAPDERLFLMFFGINRAHKLISGNMYEAEDAGEKSTLSKLLEVMKQGAKYGINCIVWGENLPATSKIIGANIERDFAQRIVFATDDTTMEQLVMEQNGSSLRPTTAVYMDVDNDVKNTHFRLYEIPAKVWVDKIAKVYREFE